MELNRTINDLLRSKSLGPDGFIGEFYKHFKDLIEPDFILFLEKFHQANIIPSAWGQTHLIFIHKSKNPTISTFIAIQT